MSVGVAVFVVWLECAGDVIMSQLALAWSFKRPEKVVPVCVKSLRCE